MGAHVVFFGSGEVERFLIERDAIRNYVVPLTVRFPFQRGLGAFPVARVSISRFEYRRSGAGRIPRLLRQSEIYLSGARLQGAMAADFESRARAQLSDDLFAA